MQAGVLQLILHGYLGDYHAPENVYFCAAGNRASDKAGAFRLILPLANRFVFISLEPNLADWKSWAYETEQPGEIIGFLSSRAALLHDVSAYHAGSDAVPTPRSWANGVGRLIKIAGAHPDDSLWCETVAGCVGEAAATEFVAYLRDGADIVPIGEILKSPDNARLPAKIAAIFATVTNMAAASDKNTFDRFCAYARRLGAEFWTLLVMDSRSRDKSLMRTKGFISWAAENPEIVLG